jgi:hypothetical protein
MKYVYYPDELRAKIRQRIHMLTMRAWRAKQPPKPRKKRDLNGLSKDHAAYMRFCRANHENR